MSQGHVGGVEPRRAGFVEGDTCAIPETAGGLPRLYSDRAVAHWTCSNYNHRYSALGVLYSAKVPPYSRTPYSTCLHAESRSVPR